MFTGREINRLKRISKHTPCGIIEKYTQGEGILFTSIGCNVTQISTDKKYTWTIDTMLYSITDDLYAPFNMRILSIENIVNNPIFTIEVNDNPYILGDLINQGDKIVFFTNVPGVTNVHIIYE